MRLPAPVNFRMALTLSRPAKLALLLSMTIRSGTPLVSIARLKDHRAAALLQRSKSIKSRGFARLIGGSVIVRPPPFNIGVGFNHAPGYGRRPLPCLGMRGYQGQKFHRPTIQCCMANIGATLLHGLFRVAIGNAVSHIKIYRVRDHAFGIMGSLEINRHPIHPDVCLFEHRVAKSASRRETAKFCERTLGRYQKSRIAP